MDALLVGCLDLVETCAFGGFAAKGDLLRDLGELVFEGSSGASAHMLARCRRPPLRAKRRRSGAV
ncbi:hypothetical protein NPS70_19855 [Streptomyces sp. C10-9-1]|uniref:hypothetical protein n=1 Tax=Streptomyces sp. C10-9-1 TaxID=1859285 RepID=UPI00211269BC|nr:hypothetical protein [Streptomyces sp. C10-9-1]MCQ6555434.1 hypothetical protein [Streptomyces sp. C10-9-1]